MPCYRAERLVVGGGVEQGSGEDRSLGIINRIDNRPTVSDH